MRVIPPHAFICGLTAAVLWGLPLESREEKSAWRIIHVGVAATQTRIRRKGVHGFRMAIDHNDVVLHKRIRVLSIERVWVELSRVTALPRFVAITDHILAWRNPLASLESLNATLTRFAGAPGAAMRRDALELCDDRAESPRESMVRVVLVVAGLPRPLCNVDIFDGSRFVARVDMLYRTARVIIEYDGDYHRDPAQWSRDQVRRAELESLGYRFISVTARDFDDLDALVSRIRRVLVAQGSQTI